jgi:hypothetical protein
LDVLRVVSSSNGLLSPASFGMLAKITRGFRIPGVKISPYEAAVSFAHAMHSSTLENMNTATLDVLNGRCRLEEYIYR